MGSVLFLVLPIVETVLAFFSTEDDNLGVLKSTVRHVYVGGGVGLGACPAVEG